MFLKLSKSTNVVDGERVLNDQQYMKFQKTIENHKQEVLQAKKDLVTLNKSEL